jgi:hypothetical protein
MKRRVQVIFEIRVYVVGCLSFLVCSLDIIGKQHTIQIVKENNIKRKKIIKIISIDFCSLIFYCLFS